jgi:hypothetical protein
MICETLCECYLYGDGFGQVDTLPGRREGNALDGNVNIYNFS